jgi:hypothetical protein
VRVAGRSLGSAESGKMAAGDSAATDRACLVCYHSISYQFFGHDQKVGSSLDSYQFFGFPMLYYQL